MSSLLAWILGHKDSTVLSSSTASAPPSSSLAEMQCIEPQSVEVLPQPGIPLVSPSLNDNTTQTASPRRTPPQTSIHTRSPQVDPHSIASFSQTGPLKRKDLLGSTHCVCSEDEVAIMDSGLRSGAFPAGKRRRVLESSQPVPSEHAPFIWRSSRTGRRVVAPAPPAPISYGKFHLWLQDVLTIEHVLSFTPGICSICLSHSYHQSMYRHSMDSHITPAMEAILNHQSTPEQLFLLLHYTIIVDITTFAGAQVVKECIEFSSAHRDRHPSTVATACLDPTDYPGLVKLAAFLSRARLRPQEWVPKYKWVCRCRSRFPTLEELKQHVEDEETLVNASNHQTVVPSLAQN